MARLGIKKVILGIKYSWILLLLSHPPTSIFIFLGTICTIKSDICPEVTVKLFECISKVSKEMTTQAVANTLYAISTMGYNWNDLDIMEPALSSGLM